MPCDHDDNPSIGLEKLRGRGWRAMDPYNVGPCRITTEVSADETKQNEKMAVVEKALNRVSIATEIVIPQLSLFLAPNVRCVAFMGEGGGNRIYNMFLGEKLFQKSEKQLTAKASGVVGGQGGGVRGVADQLYDTKRMSTLNPSRWVMSKAAYQEAKANAKAEAVVVHELGHILHEKESGKDFWEIKKNKGKEVEFQEENDRARPINAPMKLANQVSQYAGTGIIEYIAEVFTGLVYGTHYSDEVIALYVQQGGTAMVMDPRTKRK